MKGIAAALCLLVVGCGTPELTSPFTPDDDTSGPVVFLDDSLSWQAVKDTITDNLPRLLWRF